MSVEFEVATPLQMIAAWMFVQHRPDPKATAVGLVTRDVLPDGLEDPIFNEHVDGRVQWHRARDIRNPLAIKAMKDYLHEQGLVAPRVVEMAWSGSLDRQQWVEEVEARVEQAISLCRDSVSDATEMFAFVAGALLERVDADGRINIGFGKWKP